MDQLVADELFWTLAEQALPDALFVHDHEGRFLAVNDRACTTLGYTRDELLGMRVFDIETGLDPAAIRELWRKASPGRIPLVRGVHRCKDGRRLPMEVQCALLVQGQSRLYVGVVRYARELQPHASQDPVEEAGSPPGPFVEDRATWLADQRFSAVIHNSSVAIAIARPDGVYTDINQAFLTMFGFERDEVIGHSSLDIGIWVDLAQRSKLRDTFRRQGKVSGFEADFRRKDGSTGVMLVDACRILLEGLPHTIGMLSDISARKRQDALVHDQAYLDPLTQVANRRRLHDRLAQVLDACRQQGRLAGLMMIDLDHFKQVNDAFGHVLGDRLLAEAAQRLTAAVGADDTVARFGGDEFVVLVHRLEVAHGDPIGQMRAHAERIHAALAAPYHLGTHRTEGGEDVPVSRRFTASIGVTLVTGKEADAEVALRHADLAMYRAKREGRDCVRFFVGWRLQPG